MRYLGIDYGTKRIGLALSDESGTLAFAHSTIESTGSVEMVSHIAKDERVHMIVLGESLDLQNKPNPLMGKIKQFKHELEKAGFTVVYEPEMMTSAQAGRNPAGEGRSIASPGKSEKKSPSIDASAAALILQGYLDKMRGK